MDRQSMLQKAHLERTEKELKAQADDIHAQKQALDEQQRLLSSSWQTHQVIGLHFGSMSHSLVFRSRKQL